MKKTIGLGGLLLVACMSQAQGFKVETVKMRFDYPAADQSPEFYQSIDDNLTDITAAETHPKTANDPKMWYYRGLTYLTLYLQGNDVQKQAHPEALDVATESFYNAIKTDIKDKYRPISETALLNCAIGHYNNGVAFYKDAKYKEAIASYDRVLKIIPLDKDGSLKRSNIIEETVIQYSSYAAIQSENYPLAKQYLKTLIDRNFADPNVYVEMVRIHLLEKDTTGALNYIVMGREMFDKNVTLIEIELDLYLKQGRSKELIDKLNNAIALDPENKVYYFARAVSSMKLGRLNEAEADYLKTIQLDPTFADAYYNLGVVYVDRCKPIADRIDQTRDYKTQNALAVEIDNLYIKAAKQFEEAMVLGAYSNAEKLELAQTLKKLYGRLMQNNPQYKSKYDETKALITSLE